MLNLPENIIIIDNVSKDSLQKMMPAFRYELIELLGSSLNEIHCFAMKNESEQVIAICVYITKSGISKNATLLYIQVIKDYRKQTNATTLFFASAEQMKKWGYLTIDTFAHLDTDHQIIKKWGLSPLSHECYMFYNLDSLLSSKVGKSMGKLAPIIKHVKKISDLSQKEIDDFNVVLQNNGYHSDIKNSDPELTRFYAGGNGKIVGYLPLVLGDDGNSYTNTDLYIQKNENANIALPAMLADFLHSGKDKITQDSRLVMHVVSKVNYNTMVQGFGKPDEEVMADSYLYTIPL